MRRQSDLRPLAQWLRLPFSLSQQLELAVVAKPLSGFVHLSPSLIVLPPLPHHFSSAFPPQQNFQALSGTDQPAGSLTLSVELSLHAQSLQLAPHDLVVALALLQVD